MHIYVAKFQEHCFIFPEISFIQYFTTFQYDIITDLISGFVRVLENLESPGILLWHFPGLESPGKMPLVLESSGNLLNSTKNMKCMEGSKEN